MDPARLVSPPRLSTARALVLLAAIAGLFAMHGLTDHGATHWGEHVTMDAATPLAAPAQSHDRVAVDDAVSSTVGAGIEGATGTEDGRLPADMGLMGLCLAALGLAALVATRLMLARSLPGGPVRRLLHGQLARSAPLRMADPPDRHRLQVHRC